MTDAELIARLRDGCNLQQRDGERAADRIEQLKPRLFRCATDLQIYMDAFAVSEAKLAKAVELLTLCRDMFGEVVSPSDPLSVMLNETLAEIKST